MLAAYTENGPCLVPETGPDRGKAVFNPHAWNSNATVIWLDQPAYTGFSWGLGDDKDEAGASAYAYAFLQAFFKAHPALQKLPFFIVGESYGGACLLRPPCERPLQPNAGLTPTLFLPPHGLQGTMRPRSPTPSRRATSPPPTSRSTSRAWAWAMG